MACLYISLNVVHGENFFSDGQVEYWGADVSPDGQQLTLTDYKDKARTKVKATIALDRLN
jgi:hypothetical protein